MREEELIKDPDLLYLSKRIDTLEKNQKEILELLKKVLSPSEYAKIEEIARKAAALSDRQALRDGEDKNII